MGQMLVPSVISQNAFRQLRSSSFSQLALRSGQLALDAPQRSWLRAGPFKSRIVLSWSPHVGLPVTADPERSIGYQVKGEECLPQTAPQTARLLEIYFPRVLPTANVRRTLTTGAAILLNKKSWRAGEVGLS